MPLLNFGVLSRAPYERLPESAVDDLTDSEDESVAGDLDESGRPQKKKKRLWSYIPLFMLALLLFGPQYHILKMLVSYFLQIHHSPVLFTIHLSVIYGLVFLCCCSLLVCVVRDPGAIRPGESGQPESSHADNDSDAEGDDLDFMSALKMSPAKANIPPVDDDFNAPHKWCKKCWAPKPERTHHCSVCGRCVLKMDHHCPWLANKCLGHWTYPAFLHFLFCLTTVSAYVSLLSLRIVIVAFSDPLLVDEQTAIKGLFFTLYGAIFALSIGSFFLWHAYLASTNQTTIENLSPFLLLRYLPQSKAPVLSTVEGLQAVTPSVPVDGSCPPPVSTVLAPNDPASNRSFIPREHLLTSAQRRHVRYAHRHIRLYDVGFRENWKQLIGVKGMGWKGWVYRIVFGGGGVGDGKTFPRNPRSEDQLAKLAAALASEDKSD